MHMNIHIVWGPVSPSLKGKNVALRAEAIEALERARREGESYSDVVVRLAGQRRPLSEVVDKLRAMDPVESDELDRLVREIREDNRKERRRPVRF